VGFKGTLMRLRNYGWNGFQLPVVGFKEDRIIIDNGVEKGFSFQ